MTFPKTCPHCDAGPGPSVNSYLCGTYLRAGYDSKKHQTKRCVTRQLYAFADRARQLEARLAALEAENKAMRDRFAESDTELKAVQVALRETCAALDRIAPLEADAKQAREDEEWALGRMFYVSTWGSAWYATHVDKTAREEIRAEGPTIHAALRALRAKVESKQTQSTSHQ